MSGVPFHWDTTTDDVGNITAISQTQPTAESRSYGYQDFQYFLTSGSGPWPGPLAWEYDRIGNRTSETRSGITDTYSYTPNAGLPPGHTALLDAVALAGGAGGTRDYTFGPAGHLELLDAGANVLDFGNDVVGQLASVTRTAEHSASFLYDGRGFLREIVTLEPGSGGGGGDLPFLDGFETGDPCEWSTVVGYPGPACPIPPVETRTFVTYDSQGRLRALLPESGDPSYIFTFGDRPIATYTGGPMPSFTWLTTDHLGTPILAIDNAGTALWHGGFEPFGQDYTNPTAASAGVFLRFPGQWTNGSWTDATLGTELYYNLHRWYETGTGRYTQSDPAIDAYRARLLGVFQGPIARTVFAELINNMDQNHFTYGRANAVANDDPLGLATQTRGCDPPIPDCIENTQRKACCRCHDICFFNNHCDAARDWARTVLLLVMPPAAMLPTPNCIGCNLQVVACFGLSFNIVTSQITLPCQFSEPRGLYGTP